MFSWFFFLFFSSVPGTQFKINAQTPITAILYTYLIHEFIVNVKCRMDESHRKPYICLSLEFLIQYSANGTCLISVNIRESVTSLWLLWKSYIFPDLYWKSLTWLTGNGNTCHTLILWGDPKSRCSFRILNKIENSYAFPIHVTRYRCSKLLIVK